MQIRRGTFAFLFGVLLLSCGVFSKAHAGSGGVTLVIPEGYKSIISVGAGGGTSLEEDSPNVSATVSFSNQIVPRFNLDLSIAYDTEINPAENGGSGRRMEENVALIFTATYEVTQRIALFGGFARNFLARGQGEDWEVDRRRRGFAVGGGASYVFPLSDRFGVGPGMTVLYDIADDDVRVEFEAAVGFAF